GLSPRAAIVRQLERLAPMRLQVRRGTEVPGVRETAAARFSVVGQVVPDVEPCSPQVCRVTADSLHAQVSSALTTMHAPAASEESVSLAERAHAHRSAAITLRPFRPARLSRPTAPSRFRRET